MARLDMAVFLRKTNKISVLVASIEEDVIYYFMALETRAPKKENKEVESFC